MDIKKVVIECPHCGGDVPLLYLGRTKKRSVGGKEPHPCEKCGRVFFSAQGLALHDKRSHKGGKK